MMGIIIGAITHRILAMFIALHHCRVVAGSGPLK